MTFRNLSSNSNDKERNEQRSELPVVAPPSTSAVQQIFRRVVAMGSIFWGETFKRKCQLRSGLPGFNSVDLTNVIRRCNIVAGPTYNGRYCGWEYELADLIEGYKFVVVVCLDGVADYLTNPQITVLRGSFQRGKINRRRRGIHNAKKGKNEAGGSDDAK